MSTEQMSRDQRRRRTEASILDAARELFAETGFERTTIRGVAARAGVDPALVMQHYGSKEQLFAAAARWLEHHQDMVTATPDKMPAAALADMFGRFEDDDREAATALMRNCLTHPSAAAIMRDKVMCDRVAALTRALDGPDAELRAGLFSACLIGLSMARYLLEIEPVASASREDIARVMEPVLCSLMEPTAEPSGA